MQEQNAIKLALNALNNHITTKGLRKTLERETILRTIYTMDDKVTPEEVLQKHQELFPNVHICRSTVYNSIRILLDAYIINEMKDKNSTVYCKVYGNQDQVELICNHCRQTRRVSLSHVTSQIYNIEIADFKVENLRLQLYGTCAECKMHME